jgi:predicted O-linked N-acetylglucosamine transferase (SPINDLY family)
MPPQAAHPLIQTALEHLQRGAMAEASNLLAQVLTTQGNDANAHYLQGIALYQLGRKADALRHFQRAAEIQPAFVDALYNRGTVEADLGLVDVAVTSFQQVLKLDQNHLAAYGNLAGVLMDAGRFDEAVSCLSQLIVRMPHDPEGFYNRGTVLLAQKKAAEALNDFQKALALKPDHVLALCNQATALAQLARHDEAVAIAQRALGVDARCLAAHRVLTQIFNEMQKWDDAQRHAEIAVSLAPNDPEAQLALGDVLRARGAFAQAITHYDAAILARPTHGPSFVVRADAHRQLKNWGQAAADYKHAAALQPYAHFAVGFAVHTLGQICAWDEAKALLPVLNQGLQQGAEASTPLTLLAYDASPHEQLRCANIMAQHYMAAVRARVSQPVPQSTDKIRIGYFSPDFYAHPVGHLIVGALEAHDRTRFEIVGLRYGGARNDDVATRIDAALDRVVSLDGLSDSAAVALARSLSLDIAVDVAGYTGAARSGLFAHGVAPVQVNYLGYPGTLGQGLVDYIIADPIIIPAGQEDHYGEKIVRLPDTYQANDARRTVADKIFTRAELGLPGDAFVFCAFNAAYKIKPATFEAWMRILKRVPYSVLWLLDDNPVATANLKDAAKRAGVEPQRLIFANRMPPDLHLARQRTADLFLDTWPYNAHTTASDALWVGLPVLTYAGQTFASRVAASLLHAIGAPELVTHDVAAYEALAVALAQDPTRLGELRARIMANRLSAPLFDTARFTRHLESAYTLMMERARAGLAPDHITVPSLPRS